MASFKLYLDTRSPRKDETCPVKIAINHKKSFLINLKVYTIPENFINNEVLIPGDPHRQKNINQYIKGRLIYVENSINKLTLLGQLSSMGDAELKSILDINETLTYGMEVVFLDTSNLRMGGSLRMQAIL